MKPGIYPKRLGELGVTKSKDKSISTKSKISTMTNIGDNITPLIHFLKFLLPYENKKSE